METPGPTPAQSRAAHWLEELLGRHGLCWQDAALQEHPVLCKTAAPGSAARPGPRAGDGGGHRAGAPEAGLHRRLYPRGGDRGRGTAVPPPNESQKIITTDPLCGTPGDGSHGRNPAGSSASPPLLHPGTRSPAAVRGASPRSGPRSPGASWDRRCGVCVCVSPLSPVSPRTPVQGASPHPGLSPATR